MYGTQRLDCSMLRTACLSVCLSFCFFVGCQHEVYQASDLPPELIAPSAVRLETFELTPSSSAMIERGVIQPHDRLQVTASTGDDVQEPLDWEVSVGENGSITVPLVGPVRIAGMGLAGAGEAIRVASIQRQIYTNPVVSVNFKERAVNRVTVIGAVQNPGTYELLPSSSTLGDALAAAQGLSDDASPIVDIRNPIQRGGQEASTGEDSTHVAQAAYPDSASDSTSRTPSSSIVRVSLMKPSSDFAQGASVSQSLNDGAMVTVAKKPEAYVTVMGLTGNKTLPLPPNRDVRLLDVLASVGGLRYSNWIADKVQVIRQIPGTDETATIEASIRNAKRNQSENIRLTAGDVVSVEENIFTFTIDTLGKLFGVGSSAASASRFGL